MDLDDDEYDQMDFEDDAASEIDLLEGPVESEPVHNQMNHNQLRLLLKEKGIVNSFKGATTNMLQKLLALHNQDKLPIKFYTKRAAQPLLAQKYKEQWQGITLQHLANIITEEEWHSYQKLGWIKFHLHLDSMERRMIEAYNRLTLTELGVIPGRPDTYSNASGRAGYDFGWLRTPAFSFCQYYLASHPRMYATMVGLYARSLLVKGFEDHTYTGNLQSHKAGCLLQQLLPPTPIVPHTALSICLLGLDEWWQQPSATTWLSEVARGKATLDEAIVLSLLDHRAILPLAIEQCQARLRTLAQLSCSILGLAMEARIVAGQALHSVLDSTNLCSSIASAAQVALGECRLWSPSAEEDSERAAFTQTCRDLLRAQRDRVEATELVPVDSTSETSGDDEDADSEVPQTSTNGLQEEARTHVELPCEPRALTGELLRTGEQRGLVCRSTASASSPPAPTLASAHRLPPPPTDVRSLLQTIGERDFGLLIGQEVNSRTLKAAELALERKCRLHSSERVPVISWNDVLGPSYCIIAAPKALHSSKQLC